ncbi:MAG: tetratricopeptide repeat protein [Phycisphaerae bacterium]|nr:tetratricopeptide repeat protein [Phycisphaerae bacterium]
MASKTKTTLIVVAAVVLVAIIIVFAVDVPGKMRQKKQRVLLANAQMALARGQYEQAEKYFLELLEYMPDSAGLMIGLSQTCVKLNRFEDAREWADKAAAAAPGEPQPRLQKASVYRHEAAHGVSQAKRPPSSGEIDRIAKLCGQADALIDEAGKVLGTNPMIQAERGQLSLVKADATALRADALQDQADKLRAAGQTAQAEAIQKQADTARDRAEQELADGVMDLSAAYKLVPGNMQLAELYAEACFKAGRWGDAIVAYRTATAHGPPVPTPRTAILAAKACLLEPSAETSYGLNRAGKLAKEILVQASKQHRLNADIRIELADVELQAGSPDEAEQFLGKAETLAKPSPETTLLRAGLLLKQRRPEDAKKLLEGLDQARLNSADMKMELAVIEGHCGRADSSLDLLRQAVSLAPDLAKARLLLARQLVGRGVPDQAWMVLREGLYRRPFDMRLFRALATLAVRQGRQDQLEATVVRAEQGAQHRPAELYTLVSLCLELGQPSWAKRIVENSIKPDPKAPIARLVTAAEELAQGKAEQVVEKLGPVGSQGDQTPALHLTLAIAYATLGRLMDADAQIQQAFVAGEDDYLVALRAIDLYLSSGMLTEAENRSQHLLDEDPEAPVSLWQAARLALLSGNLAEATNLLNTAGLIGWQPSSPDQKAARALLAGRYDQALAASERGKGWLSRLIAYWALRYAGRDDQATTRLEEAIKAAPKLTPLYMRMADHFIATGKSRQGIDRLGALTKLDHAGAALGIGRIQVATRDYDGAFKTYQTCLDDSTVKLDKYAEGELRLAVANTHERRKNTQKEMEVYQWMQKDAALGMKGLEAAIALMTRAGRPKQVTDLLDNILKAPTSGKVSPDLLAKMAVAYGEAGRADKAATTYERIIQRLPEMIWPRQAKARAYRQAGKVDQAIAEIDAALANWPGCRPLRRELASLYAEIAEYPKALETLSAIRRAEGADAVVAPRDRAILMTRIGLCEAAQESLARVVARPENLDFGAQLALARCLGQLGNPDEAIRQLSSVPVTAQQGDDAAILRARIDENRGKIDEAVRILTQAAAKTKDGDAVARVLFDVLLRQARVEQAIQLARKRAENEPPDAVQWALEAGMIPPLQSASDSHRANVGLGVRLAAWLLANADWQGVHRVLGSLEPTTTTQATSKPAPAPLPAVECLRALADIASGQDEAGVKRLEALARQADLPADWRGVLAASRLAAKKGIETARIRKMVGETGDWPLIDALAKRAGSAEGKKAAQWVAASLLGLRLRLLTLSYRLAEAATVADKDGAAGHVTRLAVLRAMGAGKSPTVAKLSDEFVKRFGDSTLARQESVRSMLARGQLDQAAKILNGWRDQGAIPTDLAYDAGVAFLDKGLDAQALAWFEQCLKQDPTQAAAVNNVAYLLAELRGKDQASMDRAQKLSEQAIRLGGRGAAFAETLGWILVKRGRTDDGLRLLQRVIAAMADDERTHYHLAQAYEAAGLTEMARLHYAHVAQSAKDKTLAAEAQKALDRLPKAPATTTAKAA